MKNFIISILFFISNILFSQYIPGLSITQNGANQIKAHLTIYLPDVPIYIYYSQEINQNTITLSACTFLTGAGAVSFPEHDYFVDIPDNGNYTLIVNLYTSYDETTCDYHTLEDTKTLTFTTPINGTISLATIESQNINQNFVLFPNPTKGILNIQTDQKIEKVNIYDSSGKLVLHTVVTDNKIDVSPFKNGVYFMEILGEGKMQRKKFVVQK